MLTYLIKDLILLGHAAYHQLLAIVAGCPVPVVVPLVLDAQHVGVGLAPAVDGVNHGVPEASDLE